VAEFSGLHFRLDSDDFFLFNAKYFSIYGIQLEYPVLASRYLLWLLVLLSSLVPALVQFQGLTEFT